MSSATANGWPYVTDSDLPVQYPVTSLALATKLDSAASDTGWRNISASHANGFGVGATFVRRTGAFVTLSLVNVQRAAVVDGLGATILGAAPAGFTFSPKLQFQTRAHLINWSTAAIHANSWLAFNVDANNWAKIFTWPANGAIYESITYLTDAPWPATLPGNPA